MDQLDINLDEDFKNINTNLNSNDNRYRFISWWK